MCLETPKNSCDLDFDLMTLVLKLDQDIVVTYLYTKNEVKRSFGSNIIVWKYRHTECVKPLPTLLRGR